VIGYYITEKRLSALVLAVEPNWEADASAVLLKLPANPKSKDFTSLWSNIKQIYIDLQHSKCCFCEKELEHKIEQDVEHFRPKTKVKPWTIPPSLSSKGISIQQPANGASEPGYKNLAYKTLNYAIACKVCNSILKKNYFPIEGTRDTTGTSPKQLISSESNLLIYPIGSIDTDPETLIEFIGLSPFPMHSSGFNYRRAQVTIEIFGLDDSVGRRRLFKTKARLIHHLFLALERLKNAQSTSQQIKAQKTIDALTSPESPFTNCMRSFARLYSSNPSQAELFADDCENIF